MAGLGLRVIAAATLKVPTIVTNDSKLCHHLAEVVRRLEAAAAPGSPTSGAASSPWAPTPRAPNRRLVVLTAGSLAHRPGPCGLAADHRSRGNKHATCAQCLGLLARPHPRRPRTPRAIPQKNRGVQDYKFGAIPVHTCPPRARIHNGYSCERPTTDALENLLI